MAVLRNGEMYWITDYEANQSEWVNGIIGEQKKRHQGKVAIAAGCLAGSKHKRKRDWKFGRKHWAIDFFRSLPFLLLHKPLSILSHLLLLFSHLGIFHSLVTNLFYHLGTAVQFSLYLLVLPESKCLVVSLSLWTFRLKYYIISYRYDLSQRDFRSNSSLNGLFC